MTTNGWIVELASKRLAQRSNVYLLETFDLKRLQQFKEIVRGGKSEDAKDSLKELFKTEFEQVVDYSILRNQLYNLRTMKKLEVDPMTNPLKEIDTFLMGSKAFVVIEYVCEQRHADSLSDYLVAWSQDSELHSHKSTVLVFTSNMTLFNETLRRLAYAIVIPASTEEERWAIGKQIVNDIETGFKEKYDKSLKLKFTHDHVQASAGLDTHSVETCILDSFYTHRNLTKLVDAFTEYKIKILQASGLQYVQPEIDFNVVGGYTLLKEYIRNRVILPLRNPEKAKYYGVGLPKGLKPFKG